LFDHRSLDSVKGYIGCRGSSNAMLPSIGTVIERNEHNQGGRIYVLGGTGGVETKPEEGYSFAWAAFGPAAQKPGDPFVAFDGAEGQNIPVKLVAARPEHGCKSGKYEVKVSGSVAVVLRGGGCSFGDKAMEAMKVGAIGIIIVDDDNKGNAVDREPQRVMATEEQMEAITIPTVMAVHSLWQELFYADARRRVTGPAAYGLGVTE